MISQEKQWLLTEKYHGIETKDFLLDCARLVAGEPLGYVIGQVPFLDCQIWLDSKPLIPRPETEYWTELAISHIKKLRSNQSTSVRVLDLCAGSGAIGVAVAKAIPDAVVTFAELDPTHLPTIKKNLQENTTIYSSISSGKISQTYEVIESNLYTNVSGVFDVILTNPPYIDVAANTVTESVTDHEPHLALFGGVAGMEVITQIITEAKTHLTPLTGQLWIEHEPFQAKAIHAHAATAGFVCTHHGDQYHTVRYSILTWPMAL